MIIQFLLVMSVVLSCHLQMPNGMCCAGMERHLINGHHGDAITKQFIMAQSSLRASVQKSSFMYLL